MPVMPYFTREHLHTGTGAYSLIWITVILAIFVPLAIMQYKRAASR